jgi:23S rRNA (uracil1939-C5)-methyltransferase
MDQPAVARRRRKGAKPPIDVELVLGEWGAKGAVDAEYNNRVIPIDRGIPGETVVATIDRRRRQWRGVVQEITEPSPHRIEPPCPYVVAGCGGCQWQHLQYNSQLAAKREMAVRELERHGVKAGIDAVHGMDTPWRYRHTASIAIGWEAGFRPRGRRGIIEIHDCPISHPLIGMLADRVNHILRDGLLPNYHGAVWLDCTVVGAVAEQSLQVLIQGIHGLTLETNPELPDVATLLAGIDGVSSVAYRHRSGEARPLCGALESRITIDGSEMSLPAGSFSQTNVSQLSVLLRRMREVTSGRAVVRAADVYGGAGTFALALAGGVGKMTLIELDEPAVEAARRTAAEHGRTNVSCISGHAEQVLPQLGALDLIVVDPPRSGVGSSVTAAIIESGAPLVLYVSCSPHSLARDLAELLSGGYSARSIELFDFYPQTYHVECLAVLER